MRFFAGGLLPAYGGNHCVAAGSGPAHLRRGVLSGARDARRQRAAASRVATTQRSGEPAWHRRQRRARAQARVIARLAAAKGCLAGHHSAQRNSAAISDGEKHMAKQSADAAAPSNAKRGPLWSCNCGAVDNWADRKKCRVCNRDAPAAVLRRQREAQAAASSNGGVPCGNGGGGAKQRGGGGGGGNAAARVGSAVRGAPSYANVARGGGGDGSVTSELAELRRANERLQRQVSALQAGKNAPAEDNDEDDTMDAGGGEKAREERIRVLTENLKAVALVFTEESDEYRAKKAELDSLVRARREGKPLNVQIQRVDKRIEAQRRKLTKAEEQVELERQRLVDAQSDLAAAQKEAADAKSNLGELEEERKQLLIREAQALQSQAAVPAPAAVVSETEAWERTMGSIAVRVRAPGVQPELAAEVSQVLGALRALCSRLPADAPVDPPVAAVPPAEAAATAAAAAAAPAEPAAVGLAQPHVATGTSPATSVPTAHAAAAAATADAEDGTNVGDASESGDIEVDAEGEEMETAFAGISAEQRERIREIMGRRRRAGPPGRLKKPLEDGKPNSNPKKPAKGGE